MFIGKPNMAVKDIEFTYGEGQTFSAPQWATESTLQKLVEAMGGSKAQRKQTANEIKSLTDLANEIKKGLKKNNKKAEETLEETTKKLNLSMEAFGGKLGGVGWLLDKLVGGALLALTSVATLTTAKFVQLGNALNSLSQSGLALDGSTIQNIAALNEFGMGTEGATKFMIENAQAFRVLGQSATQDVIGSFLDVTKQGNDLGMSLNDTISLLGDELTLRTQLFSLAKLDQSQQKAMMQGVAVLSQEQLGYSKVLGVSTETQREFTQQVLGNNQMLMASFLRMPTETQAGLTTGVASFVSGMRAMGGEAGGEIAAAVLEAASMGAVGFSDAAYGFITVLPSMAENFQDVIRDFESGFINGKQAAMALTDQLGNLSDGEKSRVFLLARAGDEQAKMMAKAIKQFEQSAETMKKQGTTLGAVQVGFNALNTIMSKLRGAVSSVVNNFMAGFGEGFEEMSELMKTFANQIQGLMRKFFGLDTGVGKTSDAIQDFGRTVAEKLGGYITSMIEWISGYMDGMTATDPIGRIKEILGDVSNALIEGIAKAIGWTLITAAFVTGIGLMLAKVTAGMMGGAATGTAVAGTAVAGGRLAAMGAGLTALTPALPVIAGLTLAVIGLAGAFALASLGFEAFGTMVKSILEGFSGLIDSVLGGIGKIIDKASNYKTSKIKAQSDAAVAATEATTKALLQLDGIDETKMASMAVSVDALGNSLAMFASNMSPTVLGSIRSGVAGLFGTDSPIKQVLAMSQEVNPAQVMDVAKAIMATNAANSGATSLDSSLQPAVVNNTTNNNNNINTSNTNNSAQTNADVIKILSEGMVSLKKAIVDLNTSNQAGNKILKDINSKTG